MNRNTLILSLARAIMGIVVTVNVLGAPLAALRMLAPSSLLTLPLAFYTVCTALVAVPASAVMAKRGRRAGFLVGSACGIAGTLVSALAIALGSFPLLCTGSAFIGLFNGVGHFLPFAAADGVENEPARNRAMSLVVAGGVAAGICGPSLALWTRDRLERFPFLASYFSLALLVALGAASYALLRLPRREMTMKPPGRPITQIVRYPHFIIAVIAGPLSFGIMSLMMMSMPLAMHSACHSFNATITTTQAHVIGMYAPSFVTAFIVDRLGVLRVITLGFLLQTAAATIACTSSSDGAFFWSLLLVGVGWNFAFVGASILLTRSCLPGENTKAEAVFNSCTHVVTTMSALSAGALEQSVGWSGFTAIVAPLALALTVVVAFVQHRRFPKVETYFRLANANGHAPMHAQPQPAQR